jgi:predicted secreted protein
MSWTLGLALYFLIWWVALFAVLPFGVRSQREAGEVVPGSDPGAPARTRFLFYVVANTIVSAIVWIAIDVAYIYFYKP